MPHSAPAKIRRLRPALFLNAIAILATHCPAQVVETDTSVEEPIVSMEPYVVTSERSFAADTDIGEPTESWTEGQIGLELPVTLDALLTRHPAVSTYRRTTGLAAHPATEGVRLRNTATNATSRTLVVMDGIPQNDPFGGWIQWNRLPLQDLNVIRVYPNGRNGAWGNLASGGVISLTPRSMFEDRGRLSLQVGTQNTFMLSGGRAFPLGESTALDLSGTLFTTDGFNRVLASQRGPIDEPSWSRYGTGNLRLGHQISDSSSLTATIGYFSEERGNGTPLARNESEASDFSLQFETGTGTESVWQAVLFHQRREFSNVFASVNEDRTEERPVLDQYDVPGSATGLSLNMFRVLGPEWDLIAGADLRLVDGEVNELYRNLGQGFTRNRSAGGDQTFAGAFANIRYRPSEKLSLDAILRADYWRNDSGYRQETDLETGNSLTDIAYDASSGWEPTLGLSATLALTRDWTTALSLSRGFRAPTLNELYRPYRVVNDITEANPFLIPETSTGLEWTVAYSSPSPFHGEFGIFGYRLEDMVSNVFRSAGPGVSPICGFVPGGGSCNERENVERSETWGGEIKLGVDLTRQLTLSVHGVYTNTEITQAPEEAQLTGKAFPQSPVFRGSVEIDWKPTDSTRAFLRYNYTGTQFDDALNTRELAAANTLDLAVDYRFASTPWSIGLAVNNLLDADIEAGLSSGGLITLAEPRIMRLAVRYEM